jgi:Flp pilus assembly protein TadD
MNRPTPLIVRFAALCILFGIVVMVFVSSFGTRPALVKETRGRGASALQAEPAASSPDDGLIVPRAKEALADVPEERGDELMELMRKLQAAPNDADVLLQLGDTFIAIRDWRRAEVFLGRAVLSRPKDTRPRYLLGICQYRQNKFEEAARSYEELILLKEEPAAMYNLAVIYKYHTGKKAEAESLLRRILSSPEADADTVGKAKAEL